MEEAEEDHQLPRLRARLRKLTKARLLVLLENIQLELATREAADKEGDFPADDPNQERPCKRARLDD